ncbi:MAG TPA: acyloxyacyl hydrolase [Hyphomicrobium sp.]|nr:acyloxyacyl hydrolase [Hyphomicrobium sp.]
MMRFTRSISVVGFVAAMTLVAASTGACADDMLYALKIGALAHDVPGLWSGFQVEKNAVDINIEAQFNAAWALPWGAIRPVIGGSINTRGQTSDGYIDARWQGDCPSGLFFGLGLGAAFHDGEIGGAGADPDRKWLGSRVLFHIPMEVGYHLDAHNDISVYFEHMSNAYTEKYNEGMDRIGLRYGYRF